jgi:hypothetical protein
VSSRLVWFIQSWTLTSTILWSPFWQTVEDHVVRICFHNHHHRSDRWDWNGSIIIRQTDQNVSEQPSRIQSNRIIVTFLCLLCLLCRIVIKIFRECCFSNQNQLTCVKCELWNGFSIVWNWKVNIFEEWIDSVAVADCHPNGISSIFAMIESSNDQIDKHEFSKCSNVQMSKCPTDFQTNKITDLWGNIIMRRWMIFHNSGALSQQDWSPFQITIFCNVW